MIKKLHLIISGIIIILVGYAYGFYYHLIFPNHFIIEQGTTELKNVFRALMGLYWAMGMYWIIGAIKTNHWRSATISCILFMGGLAFGRIINIALENWPDKAFIIGLAVELLLMLWGIFNLRTFKTANPIFEKKNK